MGKRSRFKSIYTYWAIAVLGSLLNLFFLSCKTLNRAIDLVKGRYELIAFLHEEVDPDGILRIETEISQLPGLEEVVYTSREAAWEDFSSKVPWVREMEEIESTPLPASFTIRLKDATTRRLETTAESIGRLDGINEVIYDIEGLQSVERWEMKLKKLENIFSAGLLLLIISIAVPLIRLTRLWGAKYPLGGLMNGFMGAGIGFSFSLIIYYSLKKFLGPAVALPLPQWGGVWLGSIILGMAGGKP